jgi:hypothetical protein
MEPKSPSQAGPPPVRQPRQAAGDGPPQERWLTKARKSAGQKIQNAIKDFVDYAKNSDL